MLIHMGEAQAMAMAMAIVMVGVMPNKVMEMETCAELEELQEESSLAGGLPFGLICVPFSTSPG
jgi:hypothetical protein